MKRILCAAMALLLVFCLLPAVLVSAEEPEYENGDILKEVDFRELYQSLGYTQDTEFSTLLNGTTGFSPIYYQFSAGDVGAGDCHYLLTADGLDISTIYRRYTGMVLTSDEYVGMTDYYITVEMDTNYDHSNTYLYITWDDATPGTDENAGSYVVAGTAAKRTNFRRINDSYVALNGYVTSGDQFGVYVSEVTEDKTATYTFIVRDGKCAEVLVTCDGNRVRFTNENGIAATGYFGFYMQNTLTGLNPSLNIHKISVCYGEYEEKRESEGRELPAEAEKEYDDNYDTAYIPGYVLHNMDFAKVTSYEDTGYFFTNDSTPTKMEIADRMFQVETGDKNAYLLLSGNYLPRNIANYTVSVRFRFGSPTGSFGIFGAVTVDEEAFYLDGGAVELLTDGTMETDWTCSDAAALASAVEAMQDGEEVTFVASMQDRYISAVRLTVGENELVFSKIGGTYAAEDAYIGLKFAANTAVNISSIQVTAGYIRDYTDLTWPADADALVQTVTKEALQQENDNSDEEDTDGIDTPEVTDETPLPSSDSTQPADPQDDEKGCASSMALLSVFALALPGAAFCISRKNRKR